MLPRQPPNTWDVSGLAERVRPREGPGANSLRLHLRDDVGADGRVGGKPSGSPGLKVNTNFDPGLQQLLSDAYSKQKAGYRLPSNLPPGQKPLADVGPALAAAMKLPADWESQDISNSGSIAFADINQANQGIGGLLNNNIPPLVYTTEGLVSGGNTIANNGGSLGTKFLMPGLPSGDGDVWSGNSSWSPMGLLQAVQMMKDNGVDPESNYHRAVNWYLETGGNLLIPDSVRSLTHTNYDFTKKKGDPIFWGMTQFGYGGNPAIQLSLPADMLDGRSYRRNGAAVKNGCLASIAPIAWRGDGALLKCLADADTSLYLATLGITKSSDCFSPLTGPLAAQMAFEYSFAMGKWGQMADFTIGPDRYALARSVIGGGPESTFTSPADLAAYYIPSDYAGYLARTVNLQSPPGFSAAGFDPYKLAKGDARWAAVSQVTQNVIKYANGFNLRSLPAFESDISNVMSDFNFGRYTQQLMYDGAAMANLFGWAGDASIPTNGAIGADFGQALSAIGAGVSMVLSVVATAYTAGAASPLIGLAISLFSQAITMEQQMAQMVKAVGYNGGIWHSVAGLSGILNSGQLSKVYSEAENVVAEVGDYFA